MKVEVRCVLNVEHDQPTGKFVRDFAKSSAVLAHVLTKLFQPPRLFIHWQQDCGTVVDPMTI